MEAANLAEAQAAVQTLLGRCILRLQLVERLLKSILARHQLAGPVSQLARIRQANIQTFGTSTLGVLVGKFFDTVLVPHGDSDSGVRKDRSTQEATFGYRLSIQTTTEQHEAHMGSFRTLVELRNQLVHHFYDDFDLSSSEGCRQASAKLDDALVAIQSRLDLVREWGSHLNDSRALMRSLMTSPQVNDALVDGILPGGQIVWAWAGIVVALQDAITALGGRNWTNLDDAVAWISQHRPVQVPSRYGCRSWADVLSRSGVFEQQKRPDPSGQRVSWFRPRRPQVRNDPASSAAPAATRN